MTSRRSTRKLAVSAQWRSSRTSRTGLCSAREETSRAMRLPRQERAAARRTRPRLRDRPPAGARPLRPRGRPSCRAEVLERLAPRPQRRGPVVLRAAPGRHHEAALRRELGDLRRPGGTSDPGLAHEQGVRRFAGRSARSSTCPSSASSPSRPTVPQPALSARLRPGGRQLRRGVRDGTGRSAEPPRGRSHCCRAGSWTSTACSRSRSSWPGSSPSSSASRPRMCRSAASDSAWRPDRVEREGVQRPDPFLQRVPAVACSVAATTTAWSPSASRPSTRSSSAPRRSWSSEERSSATSGWSGRSAYASRSTAPSSSSSAVDVVGDRRPVGPVGRGAGGELRRERRQRPAAGAHLVGEPVGVDLLAGQVAAGSRGRW